MKQLPAFAYLYNYYLIPDEFASPDDFLAAAARRPMMTLTRLCETGCIAPYFIEEETELTRIRLAQPDRIHLIDATLLSSAAYRECMPSSITPTLMVWPMTPVEDTSTSVGSQPIAAAAA